MALSVYGLSDIATEGGFHVSVINKRSIGIEIPPGREKALRAWMDPDSVCTRRLHGVLYFRPIDLAEWQRLHPRP